MDERNPAGPEVSIDELNHMVDVPKDRLNPTHIIPSDPTTHIFTVELISAASPKSFASNPFHPLGATLISLPPGTRTIPLAHSHSCVFIYVITGSGICWHHGTPHEMAQNDCVGFKGGEGVCWAFVNDADKDEVDVDVFEFLVFSEEVEGDMIAYSGEGSQMLVSTWTNPPSIPIGKHNGLPTPPRLSSSSSPIPVPSNHAAIPLPSILNPPPETFWPSTLFHSLVMSIPNSLPPPDTAEVAPLSILSSLTSSSCHFTVTQTVVHSHCQAPAYGPRAHSLESRILYIVAAIDDTAKLKLHVNGQEEFRELRTGSCVRLEAGTGVAWCVLNEGEEELIFLEFAQDVDEDEIFLPNYSRNVVGESTEREMRTRVMEELGKGWWEPASRPKFTGSYASPPKLGDTDILGGGAQERAQA